MVGVASSVSLSQKSEKFSVRRKGVCVEDVHDHWRNRRGEGVEAGQIVEYLHTAMVDLYGAALNNTPNLRVLQEIMWDVQVGDLVMETSTCYDGRRDSSNGVGILVEIAHEPMPDWEPSEEAPLEKIYYVKRLTDDEIYRWHNASFIRLARRGEWKKRRDEK